MNKKLIAPIITAGAMLATSIGSTFALFTSHDEANIAITSGNINILAEMAAPILYSASTEYIPDGSDPEECLVPGGDDLGEFSGIYYYQKNDTFLNGGIGNYSEGLLSLERMSPGDKALTTFKINKGNTNIDFKYRVVAQLVEVDSDDSLRFFSNLEIEALGRSMTHVKKFATPWTLWNNDDVEISSSVKVIFPIKCSNDLQDKQCTIKFSVEAVQGNAHTVDDIGAQLIEFVDEDVKAAEPEEESDSGLSNLHLTAGVIPGTEADPEPLISVEAYAANVDESGKTVINAVVDDGETQRNEPIRVGDKLTLKVDVKDEPGSGIHIESNEKSVNYEISLFNQNNEKIISTDTPMDVDIFVGKGLNITSVWHDGEQLVPSAYSYDANTGIISIKAQHFSPFSVIYEECEHEFNDDNECVKCGLIEVPTDAKLVEKGCVVRVVDGNGYMSLQEGMLALHENDTLKVLQDITLTSQTTDGLSAQKCTIDLNGKTITASGTWKLSNTQWEYMPYEEYLDLGWDTPSREEYEADPYPLGMNENPVDVTIMNGTYIVNGTDSGRIRFEHGSTGHFENVIIKSSKETTTYQGLQTVAYNLGGAIDKNTYYFTDCSFENVYLGFEGKSGSCNRYDISFEDCDFDSVTSSNGYNQIKLADYNYGDLSINNCTFNLTGNAGGGAAYCFQIGTYLSYTSGKIFNVTLIDSEFNVNNNAGIYSNRFLSYNSNYMDNSSITVSNTTFNKDGKTVEPAIKEQSPTNKSLVWVANADAFTACYAEWLAYAKSSPACASYNSYNYYLVECDGYYFVMGQGQQYATNAVITMEGDTVVKVLTSTSYGTTYNIIGETDISLELGESDNANVHIYTLSN